MHMWWSQKDFKIFLFMAIYATRFFKINFWNDQFNYFLFYHLCYFKFTLYFFYYKIFELHWYFFKCRTNIAQMFSIMHKSVSDESKKMYAEIRRNNYVTPTNFLELTSGYKK